MKFGSTISWHPYICFCCKVRLLLHVFTRRIFLNLFHVVVYKVHLDNKQKLPSYGRKATIGQFYAVILPSLEHLYDSSLELGITKMKLMALTCPSHGKRKIITSIWMSI
ncbi:hypothetical protein Salat_0025200 [Sesamum alatum]|uniref:Uncharacterized protein n=1 Tax=Sesamum alatum TaxID=300844 RepID=A0AAE1YVQ1_9LAMI|nr:hypothetical protein Salat_0025200 [Sesamum alatum]